MTPGAGQTKTPALAVLLRWGMWKQISYLKINTHINTNVIEPGLFPSRDRLYLMTETDHVMGESHNLS